MVVKGCAAVFETSPPTSIKLSPMRPEMGAVIVA